jgi:hypothetical protein
MVEHYAGRANCTCAVCRPHLSGSEVMPSADAVSTDAVSTDRLCVAAPAVPPKKRPEPPAHYLKKREKWDGYVGNTDNEGQSNDWRRFDNNIRGRD